MEDGSGGVGEDTEDAEDAEDDEDEEDEVVASRCGMSRALECRMRTGFLTEDEKILWLRLRN